METQAGIIGARATAGPAPERRRRGRPDGVRRQSRSPDRQRGEGGEMKKARKRKKARKPGAALRSPLKPSPALAAVIGSKPMPRTQVTKKLWNYIKKHKLQDPKNRRNIKADANLKKGFGG